MVDLKARGAKIKATFAKKKAAPKFSAIQVVGESANCEISQSVTFALHFSDGTTYWLSEYGMKIVHFSGYDPFGKRMVAGMLRQLADRLIAADDKFSEEYDAAITKDGE